MNYFYSLLLVVLIGATAGRHCYLLWTRREYKAFAVQGSVIALAVLTGIGKIFHLDLPSMAGVITSLSPIQ